MRTCGNKYSKEMREFISWDFSHPHPWLFLELVSYEDLPLGKLENHVEIMNGKNKR